MIFSFTGLSRTLETRLYNTSVLWLTLRRETSLTLMDYSYVLIKPCCLAKKFTIVIYLHSVHFNYNPRACLNPEFWTHSLIANGSYSVLRIWTKWQRLTHITNYASYIRLGNGFSDSLLVSTYNQIATINFANNRRIGT